MPKKTGLSPWSLRTASRLLFDLVVACDGATSRTRAIGLGCGVRDHIKPLNSWSAFYTMNRDLLEGEKTGKAYSGPGGRMLAIGPDPSGANRVIMMGLHPRSAPDVTRPLREAMKRGDSALKQHLAHHFNGVGWKCDEAIKGMMEATDLYASEMVQVKPPSLYKGRFVLVGDAGYAPGPTGTVTSLAIAGAYVLAGEICKYKGDLEAGLRGYEENMRPPIDDMQNIPPLVPTILAPQTSWGLWLRNINFAFICWPRALDFAQKFLAGAFGDSDQCILSDYEWER